MRSTQRNARKTLKPIGPVLHCRRDQVVRTSRQGHRQCRIKGLDARRRLRQNLDVNTHVVHNRDAGVGELQEQPLLFVPGRPRNRQILIFRVQREPSGDHLGRSEVLFERDGPRFDGSGRKAQMWSFLPTPRALGVTENPTPTAMSSSLSFGIGGW